MSVTVTLNGTPYTFPDQFQNYGWVDLFGPMLSDLGAQIATWLSSASGSASAAAVQAGIATAAATTATTSAATQGTSTTSLTIGTGSKTLTTQAGKGFLPGMTFRWADQANPAVNYMDGIITAYNSGTGSMTGTVTAVAGSGTIAAWNVFMEGPIGATGAIGVSIAAAAGTVDAITATYTPAISLADLTIACFVASGANTSTTPTFAPNGLTAHTITKKGGQALAAGDIPGAGAVMLLEYNLANTRWELLNPQGVTGASGATVTNPMSGNLVLTSASKQVQTFAPNAPGYYVQLPDATTISSPGAQIFILNNQGWSGNWPMPVLDSASNYIGWLKPNSRTSVDLSSTATATGNWTLRSNDALLDAGLGFWGGVTSGTDTTSWTSGSTRPSTCGLTSKLGLATYNTSSNSLNVYTYCPGDPQTMWSNGVAVDLTSNPYNDIVALNSTTAIMTIGNIFGSPTLIGITTSAPASGSPPPTPSIVNTTSTTISANSNALDVIPGIPGSVIMYGTDNSTNSKCRVHYWNGSNFTNGTASNNVNLAGSASNAVAGLSPTLAHTATFASGSIYINRAVLSGGGNTPTPTLGTATTIASRGSNYGISTIVSVNATTSLLVYTDSGGAYLYGNVLTDTGSGFTQNERSLSYWTTNVGASYPGVQFYPVAAEKYNNGRVIVLFLDLIPTSNAYGTRLYAAVVSVSASGSPVISPIVPVPNQNGIFAGNSSPAGGKIRGAAGSIPLLAFQTLCPTATAPTIAQRTLWQPLLLA